jgi:hypothetical protein
MPAIRPPRSNVVHEGRHKILFDDLGHRLHRFDRRFRVGDIAVHAADTVHPVVHTITGYGFQQVHDLLAQREDFHEQRLKAHVFCCKSRPEKM